MPTTKASPTWSDAKLSPGGFRRAGLVALLQKLYAAGKDNQILEEARE